ncbi:MAG: hypothetical protein FWG54_05345 [Bacteroidetes bacterium]|nr:hypothetical protein [Bacteroidota bacterium]
MKHLFTCFAACLFLSCCQNAEKSKTAEIQAKAQDVAQSFLTAYLHLDFDEVLPLCTPESELKADLEQNAQRVYAMNQQMQELLKKDLLAYRCAVDSLTLNPSKDSAFVAYTVFTPEVPNGIPGKLSMACEKQEWKIVKIL